ncbi:MAG: ribosome-binding factor A, partial [Candidatus Omnitrophica bacterium]|nr:ribosome-binding factor A [Candidatus Omnitrophota bacterium]
TPYIRKLLGERLKIRSTPQLRFQYDPSIRESIRIQQLLESTRPDSETAS